MGRLGVYRVLSIGHYLIAVPLLAFTTFFGLIFAPFLAMGPVWLCMLGTSLWEGNDPRLYTRIRITHAVSLVVAALLIGMGMLAIKLAERSAAQGGGLLGAWGLIPITVGGGLALLAIASLGFVRSGLNS